MIKVTDIEQLSDEWFALKAGLPSASSFSKIVDGKGKQSKQRKKYMYTLAAEKVLGKKEEGFSNKNTEHGIETEGEARSFFEMLHGVEIEKVAMCYKDEQKLFSCSPDGLIGEDGGIEIKCPLMSTHVEYLLNGGLPTIYFQQVQGSMFVTGRKYWYFMSFYQGLKPFILKVERDEVFIKALEFELNLFVKELDVIVDKIK